MLALRKFRKFIPTILGLQKLFRFKFTFRTWLFFVVSFFIIGIGIFFLTKSQNGVSANWWDDSFQYRKAINITVGSTETDITNLETLFTIDTDDLVTAGKLQSDCDDLRFTAVNGNALPYYIDSGCNGNTTKVWVLADKVPANTTTYTVYMYYGNPSAIAASNGTTFFKQRSLAGYWTLNEGVGTSLADSSGVGNTGTFGTSGSAPSWATGQFGTGLTFDGTDDYVDFGDLAFTDVGTSDFSVSVWLKTDVAVGTRYPVSKRQSCGGSFWNIQVSGAGYAQFEVGGGNYNATNSEIINDNNWHHVVFVRSGATVYPYTDGQSGGADTAAGAADIANSGSLQFGENPCSGAGSAYYGSIDDFRFYTRALSSEEVTNLYSSHGTIASSAFGTVIPSTSFGTEEVAVGPVAYWKFDEGVGSTAQDSTQNNLDGTFGTGTSAPTWVTGSQCVNENCLYFDGSWDVVERADSAALDVNQHTLSAWVKLSSNFNSNYVIFSKWVGAGNRSYFLTVNPTTNILQYSLTVNGTTQTNLAGIKALTLNKWHYVAATYDGSNMKVYVDGNLDNTGSYSGTVYSSTSKLTIGHNNDPAAGATQFFTGFMDEVKIYPYARTAAQIKQDYTSRGSVHGISAQIGDPSIGQMFSNGLVGYWKMDETGTTIADASGNAQIGTLGSGASAPTSSAGKFGNSLSFVNTNSNVVNFSGSTLHEFAGDSFTVSAWVKPGNTSGSVGRFITVDDLGSNREWSLYHSSITGTIGFYTNGETSTDTDVVTNDVWYHIVAIADRANAKKYLYLNGVLADQNSFPDFSDTSSVLRFGAFTNGTSQFFTGSLDEVRIYNRAFTSNEVSHLYNFAPNPIFYYKLDENTGTTSAVNSGDVGGTAVMSGIDSTAWMAGKYGSGIEFDAVNDNLYAGTPAALPIGASPFTSMAWIKPKAMGTYAMICWGVNTANDKNCFRLNGSGLTHYFWSNDLIVTGLGDFSNSWNHVAVTYDGTNRIIYLNGVVVGSDTTSAATVSSSNLFVGQRSDGSEYFNGMMDDVKVYNYARSQDQIVSDMNASHPAPGSPVGSALVHYRLDEGYGATINNAGNAGSTLNGTFGTGTSAPTWTNDGKFGKALTFDGTSDYVNIGLGSTYGLLNKSYTYSAWVNLSRLPPSTTQKTILGVSTGDQFLYIANNYGGTTGFGLTSYNTSASNDGLTTGVLPSINTWYHIVGVRDNDASRLRLYVDAKEMGNIALGGTGAYYATPFTTFVGARNSAGAPADFFPGSIDEVKIYSYPLTAVEVKVEYNQGKAQVMGAGSTGIGGTGSSFSAGQEYCVPGDSSTCSAPVGEWKFDEGVGETANDTSGNGTTGNFGAGTSAPIWAKGKIGSALSFDGNDYVTTSSTAPMSNVLTYTAWIKPLGTSERTIIGSVSSGGAQFRVNTANTLSLVKQNTALVGTSTGTVSNGQWSNVAVSYDVSGNYIFYINGVSAGSGTSVQTFTVAAPQFGRQNLGEYFNGFIDEIHMYNYVRTPAQIAWEYNQGKPVAWYRFDECQGTTAYNAAKNGNGRAAGNNGTITIGATGSQTSVGTCSSGNSAHAWNNGTTGKRNASLNFDGTDDYVDLTSSIQLNDDDFTLQGWFKTTVSGRGRIWDNYNDGWEIHDVSVNSGKVEFYARSSVGVEITVISTENVNDNVWHHFTVTRSTNTFSIYVDGKLSKIGSNALGDIDPATAPRIGEGRAGAVGSPFPGQIDDIKLFNYALTAAQIKTSMNEGAVAFR